MNAIQWFFESNDASARVLRTIVQGVLGVLISYLSTIATSAPDIVGLLIIPCVMAVLSPIMAEIGKKIGGDPIETGN